MSNTPEPVRVFNEALKATEEYIDSLKAENIALRAECSKWKEKAEGMRHPNPCDGIFDHKWLDHRCVEKGCQSLFLKSCQEKLAAMTEERDSHQRVAMKVMEESQKLKERNVILEVEAVSRVAPEGCPDWTCCECGNQKNFRTVKTESLDGVEYDMECPDCGSQDIAESQTGAIHAMSMAIEKHGLEIEEYEAELAVLKAANKGLREELMNLLDAWDRSYDCSSDPGHNIMGSAISRAVGTLNATAGMAPETPQEVEALVDQMKRDGVPMGTSLESAKATVAKALTPPSPLGQTQEKKGDV